VKYGRRKATTGLYGDKSEVMVELSREQFLNDIVALQEHNDKDLQYYVNARVTDSHFSMLHFEYSPALHVMILDCDSLENMSAAAHLLAVEGVGYALIESSNDKYWVVTDVVAPIDEVAKRMSTYPGVDPNYVKLVARTKQVPIRAIPLPGRVPRFSVPDGLTNNYSREFYRAFEDHYSSPEIVRFLAMRIMVLNLKNGTMAEVMANPQFRV
jgi:hypothetical protein